MLNHSSSKIKMTPLLVVCLLCCTAALRPTMMTRQIRGFSVRYKSLTMMASTPPPSRYNARQSQSTTLTLEKEEISQPEIATTKILSPIYKSITITITICLLFLLGWSADLPTAKKELIFLGTKSMMFASTLSSSFGRYVNKLLAIVKTATSKTWLWYYLSIPLGLLGIVYMTKSQSMSTSLSSSPSPTIRPPRTTLTTTINNNSKNNVLNTSVNVDKPYTVISSPHSNNNNNHNNNNNNHNKNHQNNSSTIKPYTIISSPTPTTTTTTTTFKPPITINAVNSLPKPFKIDVPPNPIVPPPTSLSAKDTRASTSAISSPPNLSNIGTTTPTSSLIKSATVTPIGVKAADVLLNDLIDIKRMFEKIDSEHIADLISPNLYRVVDKVMVKDVRAVRTAKGIPAVPVVYEVVLRARTQVLVRKVIDRVKEDPTQFIDFKSLIASEVAVHDQLIRSIVSRSRRFVVVSCSMIATVASLVQLFCWLGWDTRISMGLLALGLLLEMVFLDQQEQVMIEFAQLLTAKLLSPQKLWKELTYGPKHAALVAVIAQELRAEFSLFIYSTANGGNYREFANKLREALPDAATPSYRHLETVLNVKGYLRAALRKIGDNAAMFYGI